MHLVVHLSITLKLGINETAMKWTKDRLPARHPKLCLPLEADCKKLELSVRTTKKKLFSGQKEVVHGMVVEAKRWLMIDDWLFFFPFQLGPWGFDLGMYKPYEVISLRCDLLDSMGSIKFGTRELHELDYHHYCFSNFFLTLFFLKNLWYNKKEFVGDHQVIYNIQHLAIQYQKHLILAQSINLQNG